MSWIKIADLIIEVGYSMAMKIWQNALTGGNATQAQWDELEAMTKQKAVDRMMLALVKAGVDPTSEQGKALLALAQ